MNINNIGSRVILGAMVAAILAWFLAFDGKVGRDGEPGRLKFGGLMWVQGFVALSMSLLVVVSYNGKEPWASLALFLGLGIMAIYWLGDAALVRGTYDNEGIEFSTPWTGMKRKKWRDLQSVELNHNLWWYALKFRSGSTIRLSLNLRGHLSALEMANSRGELDGPPDDDLPQRRDLPLYALSEDASVVGRLRVAMHFSDAAERIHRANLEAQCCFAGWIPAECPSCSRLNIAPVYVSPVRPVLGDPVMVLCLNCDRQFDWSRPFALLAQRPLNFSANVILPTEAPEWLQVKKHADTDEALRYYLSGLHSELSIPVDIDAASNQDTQSPTLQDALTTWADYSSGIGAGKPFPVDAMARVRASAHDDQTANGESFVSTVRMVSQAVFEAYQRMPSATELAEVRAVLYRRMVAVAALERSRRVGDAINASLGGETVDALTPNDIDLAIEQLLHCLALHEHLSDEGVCAEMYLRLGDAYCLKGEVAEASKSYHRGLSCAEGIGSPDGIGFAHTRLARLMLRETRVKAAREHFSAAFLAYKSIQSPMADVVASAVVSLGKERDRISKMRSLLLVDCPEVLLLFTPIGLLFIQEKRIVSWLGAILFLSGYFAARSWHAFANPRWGWTQLR